MKQVISTVYTISAANNRLWNVTEHIVQFISFTWEAWLCKTCFCQTLQDQFQNKSLGCVRVCVCVCVCVCAFECVCQYTCADCLLIPATKTQTTSPLRLQLVIWQISKPHMSQWHLCDDVTCSSQWPRRTAPWVVEPRRWRCSCRCECGSPPEVVRWWLEPPYRTLESRQRKQPEQNLKGRSTNFPHCRSLLWLQRKLHVIW